MLSRVIAKNVGDVFLRHSVVNRQNVVGDSKYGVVGYLLFADYVTQPNFGRTDRQNCLTMMMCISKLLLICIAAP